MASNELNDDSDPKVFSSSEGLSEKACLKELELPSSLKELKSILLKLSKKTPSSCTLYNEKYQMLVLNNLFKWQKPFGELLKQAIVICGAKTPKISETEGNHSEVFSEDSGSPLPLQFDCLLQLNSAESVSDSLKHFPEKNSLYPLSENIGKKLLYLCNSTEIGSLERLPILVVCYGRNPKALSFFGSWKEKKNARFCIKNEGSVTKQEQLEKLPVLKGIHLKGFPSFVNVEISVFARYDFIEYECDPNAALKPVKDVNLFVECSWRNPSLILEPLAAECQCFAKLKAISGDFNSGASSLFKEIKLVEALYQSVKSGIMAWSTPEKSRNIPEEVKEFIENEKLILKNNKPVHITEKKDSDLGATLEQALIKGRTDLDFTEKLWNILKDCSSTEELTEAFTILYNELESFFARPLVHYKNTSRIAQTIKSMMDEVIERPNLESPLVLNLLLEIGIEKLRMDYKKLFISLDLFPFACLRYFLQPELHSLEAITCLRKLHSVVESMIVCDKILKLSKPLLSSFVRDCLNHYAAVPDINLQHVFTFHIPTIKARQLLDPMRPTVWELSLKSSFSGFMKQSIHHFQTTSVHDHIYAPPDSNPNLMLETASYTYLTSVFIQDEFL